ncbi:MAG TPA: hypothetical protein VHN79_07875, partial [Lacunisphaera sp.]|nr:hypothetical protein [Lacunisphaera sp.]
FHQPADNALAFHGLARRSTQKDWTLEDAAKAAARAEADKLRAEFEAKFKAGSGQPAPEEEAETFLAEEKPGAEGSIRKLRDTSRDDDDDAPEEENGAAPKDEWDKLAAEDELPAFFDAIRPHMRRNQRGPGMSVGLDHLAKKWHLDESDLKGALVECGLQIPADENAKPVYAEYEGELYWVNINRRGEIWINLRDKPQPVFRVVQARRVEGAEEPASAKATEGGAADENAGSGFSSDAGGAGGSGEPAQQFVPREQRQQHAQHPRDQQPQEQRAPSGPKTFLDKIRGMMRRNRRGHGMSGSFQYLTKALKTDEAGLLAQLGEHGLQLAESGQPVETQSGDFVYWLNKNNRGEIWINAELKRRDRNQRTEDQPVSGAAAATGEQKADGAAETAAPVAEFPAPPSAAAGDPGAPADLAPGELGSSNRSTPADLPSENTLTAVRLLMEPKKRGEGVTALVSTLAEKLEKTPEALTAMLAAAGLQLPDSPKGKPTFAEHGGEIYWLNANARSQVWLNAKPSAATKKSRTKKSEEPATD